jgi:glycosyltransferase involved in cell wall biosynthesis
MLIGSFGTFSRPIAALLAATLPRLLQGRAERRAMLIGRGGESLAARLVEAHPALAGRVQATGGLPPAEVSRCLQQCDLLVQPYPDGVTTRRSTTMAPLAHGRAVVTNAGALTEPFWKATGALALAPSPDAAALVREAEILLADPAARARLGVEALRLYEHTFALERTVATLLGLGAACEPAECAS